MSFVDNVTSLSDCCESEAIINGGTKIKSIRQLPRRCLQYLLGFSVFRAMYVLTRLIVSSMGERQTRCDKVAIGGSSYVPS